MSARIRLRIFIVFAEILTNSEPYDAAGAFALLQDLEDVLGRDGRPAIDVAIRAHLAAALSRKASAFALARCALLCVVEDLERRLAGLTA